MEIVLTSDMLMAGAIGAGVGVGCAVVGSALVKGVASIANFFSGSAGTFRQSLARSVPLLGGAGFLAGLISGSWWMSIPVIGGILAVGWIGGIIADKARGYAWRRRYNRR